MFLCVSGRKMPSAKNLEWLHYFKAKYTNRSHAAQLTEDRHENYFISALTQLPHFRLRSLSVWTAAAFRPDCGRLSAVKLQNFTGVIFLSCFVVCIIMHLFPAVTVLLRYRSIIHGLHGSFTNTCFCVVHHSYNYYTKLPCRENNQ